MEEFSYVGPKLSISEKLTIFPEKNFAVQEKLRYVRKNFDIYG
jgi:hypothetical protein